MSHHDGEDISRSFSDSSIFLTILTIFLPKNGGSKKKVLLQGKLNGSSISLAYARAREEMVRMVRVLSLSYLPKNKMVRNGETR